MPAKDRYHDAIKNALIKDGWFVTNEPLRIRYDEIRVYADMAAKKLFSAEKDDQKIAVEVKSFISRSPVRELETALGQYIIYRGFLSLIEPERMVYLAIRKSTYQEFFQQVAIQTILKQNQILMLVVNTDREVIVQWTN